MIKRAIGLDWFDLLIHAGVTMTVMVMVLSSVKGPDGDGAVAAVVGISLGVLAWRRSRAMRNRPPETTGEVQAERMAILEDRLAELEQVHARVMELEERLDFTERLLAQQRDPARLPAGGEAK
jgi:hypothetical protein